MVARERPLDDPRTRTIRHEISGRSLLSVVAIGAGLWLLARVWPILLLLIIALVLASALGPAVAWLERRRLPRSVALGLVLVALLGTVVGIGALVVPALVTQVQNLVANAPALQTRVADTLAGVPALAGQAEAVRTTQVSGLLAPLAANALGLAAAAAQLVVLGLTMVVLAFYLLADHERVRGFVFALLPRDWHLRAAKVLLDMGTVVGGYVRGQALTSLLMGVFVYTVLRLAGTPEPLALATFAAFADLIPLIGGFLVLIPAVLATLAVGPVPALTVLAAIMAYQQVENNVLIPRVYGKTLRLSPVAVTVALLLGGQLLGIVGALLALPLTAGIRVLVENLRIDLPGELPGEAAQREADARAEADYAAQAEGSSAIEAAIVASALAGEIQEETRAETGLAEFPIEERGDPPLTPPTVRNPAR